jgi:hypothetical protein
MTSLKIMMGVTSMQQCTTKQIQKMDQNNQIVATIIIIIIMVVETMREHSHTNMSVVYVV